MKSQVVAIASRIASFIGVATPACAFAQVIPPAAAPSSVLGLGQGLIGLVIVIALIYGAAWLLRRVGPKSAKSGVVQVLGGASVGPREKVVVVRFASRTLLLGVAPGHVALLQSIDGDGAVDATPPTVDAPRFLDRVRAAKGDA